jgi:hypothetical protein
MKGKRTQVETVYDWITVAIFGGLVVLFLHRSVQPEEPQDTILHYLPPAVGCAVANWFGNPPQNQGLVSFLIVLGVAIYVVLVLKPFGLTIKFQKR